MIFIAIIGTINTLCLNTLSHQYQSSNAALCLFKFVSFVFKSFVQAALVACSVQHLRASTVREQCVRVLASRVDDGFLFDVCFVSNANNLTVSSQPAMENLASIRAASFRAVFNSLSNCKINYYFMLECIYI